MARLIIGLGLTGLVVVLVSVGIFSIGPNFSGGSVVYAVVTDGECLNDNGVGYTGNQDIDIVVGDLVNCIIQSGATVSGNVVMTGTGSLTVIGTLEGNIEAEGSGPITVSGGTVEGNIEVEGTSAVTVSGDTVEGNIESEGSAPITVSGVLSRATLKWRDRAPLLFQVVLSRATLKWRDRAP